VAVVTIVATLFITYDTDDLPDVAAAIDADWWDALINDNLVHPSYTRVMHSYYKNHPYERDMTAYQIKKDEMDL
jgi:hypothetical protein